MIPETREYDLALKAREGDREALSRLIAQTRGRLFALAYADVRHYDDAQDVVASALVRIVRHVHALQQPERIGPWMNSIVRNEARRMSQRRFERQTELIVDEAQPRDEATNLQLRIDIERALAHLPRQHSSALRLFHLESEPIREIAARFGCSEGTVKSWLHRARRRISRYHEGV